MPTFNRSTNSVKARLRLKIKPDGTLEGVLGGYQPWYPLYWSHAKVGYIDERGFGVDAPALYYALAPQRRRLSRPEDRREHRHFRRLHDRGRSGVRAPR